MYVKPFEDFIASEFVDWAAGNINPGERYQFRSPSNDVRKKIYRALLAMSEEDSVTFRAITLHYLNIGDIKLMPLLHSDDHEGLHENFLAHLRDEPKSKTSPLYGMVLLFIHNSTLDTILNSSDDLAFGNNVWHPSAIKCALEKLIDKKNEGREISQVLLDYQFDAVLEDGATMFGFEKLYKALLDGDLQFHELELFKDPFIKDLSIDFTQDEKARGKNSKQIRKRLDENRQLYKEIEQVVEHFPGQLNTRLGKFSIKFIDKHFPKGDLVSWKQVHFQVYLDEIKRNQKPTLVFEDAFSDPCEHILRNSGETKPAQRQLHVIIQVPKLVDTFDFTAKFSGNDLSNNHLNTPNSLLPKEATFKATPGPKHCKLVVKGPFDGTPLFFTVGTGGRDRPTEKYSFHCLVLRKDEFLIESFRNNFTIDSKTKVVNLHTDEYKLLINPNVNQVVELQEPGQVVDIETTRKIDFNALFNNSDLIDFTVKKGSHHLQFNIEGEMATDALTLPLLFDKDRFSKMFKDTYYGVFSRNKNKILIDNKEVTPFPTRLILLRWEARFVDEDFLAMGEEGGVKLSELSTACPSLYEAYKALYEYLKERETLPSLASWGDDFRNLIRQVVSAYLGFLEKIEVDTVLSSDDRLVLAIGMVKNPDCEYLTPYHPLVMSYYLALVDQIIEDNENASFKYLPRVTLERLTPRGLIPYLYASGNKFSYVQQLKENPSWLKAVPYKESNYEYVQKVVKEKIGEFQEAFSQLFAHNSSSKLLINAVNQKQAKELFLGIVDYFKQDLDKACYVHVNFYDDQLHFNWFDDFAEIANNAKLKEKLKIEKGKDKEIADTLIDLLRTRLTYSKFTNKEAILAKRYAYAHLTFFRNNEEIQSVPVKIDASLSSIAANGLLNGEASENKGDSYFTAFGLRNTAYRDYPHLKIARCYGALIRPARENNAQFNGANAVALAINEGFKDLLEKAYKSSIWTTIIDPKVTLDFFRHQDLTLVHFSDQYTTSTGYDAITVTREKNLYRQVLEQGSGGRIEEFNSFNGEWLLEMLTANPSRRKGIEGEIGSYKFVTSMLAQSDITWVPLSVCEMVRVSGNIGLKIMDSEFAPAAHGSNEGQMSDDILMVGFKAQNLFLLPVEVKTGALQGNDKAVKQVNNLLAHLSRMLGLRTLANKIYRALFMRQVFIQVDKYRLYDVFEADYFDKLLECREEWLRGEYKLAKLDQYPEGVILAHVDSPSVFEPDFKTIGSILRIELPFSFLPKLVNTPLKELMREKTVQEICHVPEEYMLGVEVASTEFSPIEKCQDHEDALDEKGGPFKPQSLAVELGTFMNKPGYVHWKPCELTNPHCMILGTSGKGKTQTLKSIILQLARQDVPAVIIDFNDDFIDQHFLNSTGFELIDTMQGIPVNPFEIAIDPFSKKRLSYQTVVYSLPDTLDKTFNMGTKEQRMIRDAIQNTFSSCGFSNSQDTWDNEIPEFINLKYELERISEEQPREAERCQNILSKLAPLFDLQLFRGNGQVSFDKYFSKGAVFRLKPLLGFGPSIQRAMMQFILEKVYNRMANLGHTKELRFLCVIDEAHYLKMNDKIDNLVKEARKFGIGLALSTQEAKDLSPSVWANTATVISLGLKKKDADTVVSHLGIPRSLQEDISIKLQNFDPGKALIKNDLHNPFDAIKITPYDEL